jgi:hypothetical protein
MRSAKGCSGTDAFDLLDEVTAHIVAGRNFFQLWLFVETALFGQGASAAEFATNG